MENNINKDGAHAQTWMAIKADWILGRSVRSQHWQRNITGAVVDFFVTAIILTYLVFWVKFDTIFQLNMQI
jgi:hypothetical protein